MYEGRTSRRKSRHRAVPVPEGIGQGCLRRQAATRSPTVTVIQDFYHMKIMAIEVVVALALDFQRENPLELATAAKLSEQVQEEFEHLRTCHSFLAQRQCLGRRPRYVDLYWRLMRWARGFRRRSLPLAVATTMSIAVEMAALRQFSVSGAVDREAANLLNRLHRDECDHFRLVAGEIAPSAALHATRLERFRSNLVVLGIVLITGLFWWPARVKEYEAAGLDVNLFGRALIELLSPALTGLHLVLSPQFLQGAVEFALQRKFSATGV
jgi:hypothetical protein